MIFLLHNMVALRSIYTVLVSILVTFGLHGCLKEDFLIPWGHSAYAEDPWEEYQTLTENLGRTGRIGNVGLATSFYNDRDSDLAEVLTKTLLETHQTIPDFLESYIPEGFTADGKGDINLLKFELDDDAGDAEGGEDGGSFIIPFHLQIFETLD